MQDTIDLVLATLKDGMADQSAPYYVKSWFTHDPLAVPQVEGPSASVYNTSPTTRASVFVGEDTIKETVAVRFYQPALRMKGEPADVAAGMTRLIAQLEQAQKLLRADPTFGSQFVMSEIRSVESRLPAGTESNAYKQGELQMDVILRKLWGS